MSTFRFAGRRDANMEQEALEWIYTIIGEPIPNAPYEEVLRDGIALCKLVKKIFPDSPLRINYNGGKFQMMENISNFNDEIKRLGIKETNAFQTIDLWEKRNIPQVTMTINCLGGLVQKYRPDLPTFGPRLAEENKRYFSEQQLRAGEAIINLQYGSNKGANASGMNFGNFRHL